MKFQNGDPILIEDCGSEIDAIYHSEIEPGWHVVKLIYGTDKHYFNFICVTTERIIILDTPEKKFKSFLKQSGIVHPSAVDVFSERILQYLKENPVTE